MEIDDAIDEFFPMRRGERIEDPEGRIWLVEGVYLSRRALKHIIERRSVDDDMMIAQVRHFIKKAAAIVMSPEVIARNENKHYPNSRIIGGLDGETGKGIMVVVQNLCADKKEVITIFLKERRQFIRLMRKSSP